MLTRNKGIILPVVIAIVVIITIVAFAVLTLAEQEIILTRIETDKTRAFYYAEAGIGKLSETLQKVLIPDLDNSFEQTIDRGEFRVEVNDASGSFIAISTGVSGVVQKKIRVKLNFLAVPFEHAVYAMNNSGSAWAFQLRGTGNPVATGPGGKEEKGGKDTIKGNVFIDGDMYMYEQSSINPAPLPNTWNLNGDAGATGGINVLGSASISGQRNPNSDEPDSIDITEMDYANYNTHNVSQIFQAAGVAGGYLPSGAALRNIFVKNPSDRKKECDSTANEDYFLEPMAATGGGSPKDALTPVSIGADRIYYIDGDLWIHNLSSYGFLLNGKATIVASGNIHICDNIKYANSNSMLGLVAYGKYDNSGDRISGGDIFFGDPRYGTMYTVSAMMFAANDFLYNHDTVFRRAAEPTTGFTVNGSFAAMNKVVVERDWYTKDGGTGADSKMAAPARFDATAGKWVNSETGAALSSTEVNSIRHYQMNINYDQRVRSPETQPPGLPRGKGKIFAGFSNWEEL